MVTVYYDFGSVRGGFHAVDMVTGKITPFVNISGSRVLDFVDAPDGRLALVTLWSNGFNSLLSVSSLRGDTIVEFSKHTHPCTGSKIIRTDGEYFLTSPMGTIHRENGDVIHVNYVLDGDRVMPIYGRNALAAMFGSDGGCVLGTIDTSGVIYTPLSNAELLPPFVVTGGAHYQFKGRNIAVHDVRDGTFVTTYKRDYLHSKIVKQIDDNTVCEVGKFLEDGGNALTTTILHDVRNLSHPAAEIGLIRGNQLVNTKPVLFIDF